MFQRAIIRSRRLSSRYLSSITYKFQNALASQVSVEESVNDKTTNNSIITDKYPKTPNLIENLIKNSNYSSSKVIENHIQDLIEERQYKKVWQIAKFIKDNDLEITNEIYILLLKTCYLSKKSELLGLAITLYYEVINHYKSKNQLVKPLTKKEHESIAFYILASYQNCNDFTDLFTLKILWENYIAYNVHKPIFELLYNSAYTNTLLNTDQYQVAIEYFEKAFEELTSQNEKHDEYYQFSTFQVLSTLPTVRILDILASIQDCDKLNKWIHLINLEQNEDKYGKKIITDSNWLKYLSTGLSINHYDLVKTIYDNFIMKGFENASITTEDILFQRPIDSNLVFNTITDEILFQILHTLSSNGDVNSTLSLIESHYIHKTMKGEKALTKELCIKIIESYCYHPDLQSNWDESEILSNKDSDDESVKRVLDVLNGLVLKCLNTKEDFLSYKDITECMSFKFINYKVYDANIDKEQQKRQDIAEKIKNSEENEFTTTILPRKVSNNNIETSSFGNVLANLNTLTKFMTEHIKYLNSEKKHSIETIKLFVNCVLNHINLFQNFSGTVRALLLLHKENPNFVTEWLDEDSFHIILNSLSNSTGAKLSSIHLFNYLKKTSTLTHEHYRCLISANLRGDIHDHLQFFLYNYFTDFKGVISSKIQALLDDIPNNIIEANKGTLELFMLYKQLPKSVPSLTDLEIEDFWIKNNLRKEEQSPFEESPSDFNRKYNRSIDSRDSKYLKYVLEI